MSRVSRSRPSRAARHTPERETTVAFSQNVNLLPGILEWAYRKNAVAALELSPGDTEQ